jgi:hypothetical protein
MPHSRTIFRTACLIAATAGLILAACTPAPQGARRELTVGGHRLSIHVPPDCQVLDFGREVRVSRGGVVLVLGDLGPAGPEGILSEVERAQALWQEGREQDARWVLRNIPVPDELFGSQVERTAFWANWSEVAQAPEDADPRAIDEGFERIRGSVALLARPDLPVLAGTVLERIEPKARRAVATSHPRLVSGREAVVYRTWDRLTHASPRRVAIVFDRGYALKLDTESGTLGTSGRMFQGLLDSMRFVPGGTVGAISGATPPARP